MPAPQNTGFGASQSQSPPAEMKLLDKFAMGQKGGTMATMGHSVTMGQPSQANNKPQTLSQAQQQSGGMKVGMPMSAPGGNTGGMGGMMQPQSQQGMMGMAQPPQAGGMRMGMMQPQGGMMQQQPGMGMMGGGMGMGAGMMQQPQGNSGGKGSAPSGPEDFF